jgi:hypothetical protein
VVDRAVVVDMSVVGLASFVARLEVLHPSLARTRTSLKAMLTAEEVTKRHCGTDPPLNRFGVVTGSLDRQTCGIQVRFGTVGSLDLD